MPNEQPNKGRFREPLNRTFEQWQRSFPFDWRLIACVILIAFAYQTLAQQVIKIEDQETSVAGTIKLIHDFGPPGYGEDPKHDVHVSYWAVVPRVPLNFACTPEQQKFADTDCAPAKQLKLFFPGLELNKLSELPAARWNGQRVVVTGKLHRADTAGEMTPIYMDVTTISSASKRVQDR